VEDFQEVENRVCAVVLFSRVVLCGSSLSVRSSKKANSAVKRPDTNIFHESRKTSAYIDLACKPQESNTKAYEQLVLLCTTRRLSTATRNTGKRMMHLSVRTFDERLNPICEHLKSADHVTSWPSVRARPGERRPLWQQSRPDTVVSISFAVSVGYMSPYLLGGLGCAAKDSGTGRVLFRMLGCAAKDSGTGRVLFRILVLSYFSALR
jgi:hypothetical protein